jgi:hypothetical protein
VRHARRTQYRRLDQRPEMSCTTLTAPGTGKPPGRYQVTIRVAKDDGHPADPATFAVAASQAASSRNASVVSVAAPGRPSAVAVALAVVADALRAEGRVRSPSR